MKTFTAPLALLSLVTFASAGPVVVPRVAAPANDPFYTPPAGYESKTPGSILRSRAIDAAFFGLIPDPVQAYQLLYRTTAIDGSAISTVTTIFKPYNASTDRFVSYQTAYDSAASKCNPSYTYQFLAPQTDLITSAEFFIIQGYLASGYIVSSPDYEGPDVAFSAGRLSGMGVLDSMRAVSTFSNLSFSTNSPAIVGVGYSGGAIATGWAASLAKGYAPDLPVKGWIQGGTPANLTGTLLYLANTTFSGFLPVAIAGLLAPSAYNAQLFSVVNSILTAKGRAVVDFATKNCAVADLFNYPYQSILSTTFQSLGDRLPYQPDVARVLQRNIMGTFANETPVAPVYIYHAAQDEVIPYQNASTLANVWCNDGASVSFTNFAAGGHVTTEILGFPSAITYTEAAFAGAVPQGCSRTTVYNDTLNPIALAANLEPILAKLADGLAQAGQGDSNIKGNLSNFGNTF